MVTDSKAGAKQRCDRHFHTPFSAVVGLTGLSGKTFALKAYQLWNVFLLSCRPTWLNGRDGLE